MSKSKLILLILVLTLALTCALSLVSCEIKGNEYLTKADVVVEMLSNGDIRVHETWNVRVNSDSIRNLYRELDLYDSNTKVTSELKDFAVRDNLTGEYLTYTTSLKDPEEDDNASLDHHSYVYARGSKKVEIGCYFEPSSNTDLSYTFSYTLTNYVKVYADTAVLYYQPYSTDFSLYADEIAIKVLLPDATPTDDTTLGWLHTEVADSSYEVKADAIYFNSKKVDSGNSTEIRVLAPKELFTEVQTTYGENKRQAIIQEETEWYNSYQAELKRNQAWAVGGLVGGCVLVAIGIALVVYFKVFFPKVKGEYPPYVREIPTGTTSTQMAHFYYHYDGTLKKQKNRGNVLSAILMELARRGFIVLEPSERNPDDFTIDLEEVPSAKFSELSSHEKLFYDLIKEVRLAYVNPISMGDFEAYAKDHASKVNHVIDSVIKASGKQYHQRDNFKMSSLKPQTLLGVGMICIVVGFMMFLVSELLNYFGLGLSVFGILLMVGAPKVNKLSAKGEAKYMEAKGLESFMLEFSNLKEHEIPALILWEEYMVYATMMGISERVLQELKLKYPVLLEEQEVTRGYYRSRSYLFFYVHMNHRHHGTFDLGSSLNRSLGNISTTSHHIVQAAKAQASASKMGGSGFGRGGGGFRGGGGGFGGGGGGAR
ncbi:MAG: DUF2207 domain-containing protein [Clostridia bacterium]|nr:DUF2207 domain-containing protein [Clostridia bacterium]